MNKEKDDEAKNLNAEKIVRTGHQIISRKFSLKLLLRSIYDPEGVLCDAAEIDLLKKFQKKKGPN